MTMRKIYLFLSLLNSFSSFCPISAVVSSSLSDPMNADIGSIAVPSVSSLTTGTHFPASDMLLIGK